MLLAGKIVWAGITFTLLTAGMLLQDVPQSAVGSDSDKESVATFVIKNEIKKMQETLRNKGHYLGKIDGVFGLQTRDSIRAYQKAEGLPVTGQVDTPTADGLGVRPGSTWGSSQSAGQQDGHSSNKAGGETKRDKPSAGTKWAKGHGRTSKSPRKAVKAVAAAESGRGDRDKKLQAENESHPQCQEFFPADEPSHSDSDRGVELKQLSVAQHNALCE
jgi:peptidoglycan hydrolase-like protein with peptidoglycan-binding domain